MQDLNVAQQGNAQNNTRKTNKYTDLALTISNVLKYLLLAFCLYVVFYSSYKLFEQENTYYQQYNYQISIKSECKQVASLNVSDKHNKNFEPKTKILFNGDKLNRTYDLFFTNAPKQSLEVILPKNGCALLLSNFGYKDQNNKLTNIKLDPLGGDNLRFGQGDNFIAIAQVDKSKQAVAYISHIKNNKRLEPTSFLNYIGIFTYLATTCAFLFLGLIYIRNKQHLVVQKPNAKKYLYIAIAIASIAKIYLSTLGNVFDVKAYGVMANFIFSDKNIYQTGIYNYSPLWGIITYFLKQISMLFSGKYDVATFHTTVAIFLAFFDAILAFVIAKKFGLFAGIFMALNPISLFITGYHTQFDILSLLPALLAVLYLHKLETKQEGNNATKALLFMALSICLKHSTILLPIFLFFRKQLPQRFRLIFVLFPLGLFALSFVPFMFSAGSFEYIKTYVFGYSHVLEGTRFWLAGLIPSILNIAIPAQAIHDNLTWIPLFGGIQFIWLIGLCIFMYYTINRNKITDVLVVYLAAVLFLFPSPANQYLALGIIPAAYLCAKQFGVWFYCLLSFLYLSAATHSFGDLAAFKQAKKLLESYSFDWAYLQLALALAITYFIWQKKQTKITE